MKIEKSLGITPTEKFLSTLCENTFLKIWSYPNLYKKQGDELCDLLAVFENHIFIFQDRNISFSEGDNITLAWERWSRRAVEKQIKQLNRAKNWIIKNPDKIFLDAKCTKPFPLKILSENVRIHKILVAHGAKDACAKTYAGNAPSSLAICYGEKFPDQNYPFLLYLDNKDPIHAFDSFNLEIILSELDTFYDFKEYLVTKEDAIKQLKYLAYHGEENLLGHYFTNFDEQRNKYSIGIKDKKSEGILIADDKVWQRLINFAPYFRRKEANKISYLLWDKFIQTTCQNALDGILLGNGNIFDGQSAIYEMAKEPRFTRRALSEHMLSAIKEFPDSIPSYVSFMPSFYPDKAYIFLQLHQPNIVDYEAYRAIRQRMLIIACGAAKNKYPHLSKVIGIAIDGPKFSRKNSEDFILLNCEKWSQEQNSFYEEENKLFKFFKSDKSSHQIKTISDFPIQ